MTGKEEARERARAARDEVDFAAVSPQVVAFLREWDCLAGDPVVLLYLPLSDEIDVTPLAGAQAAVTRLGDDDRLTLHRFDAPRERHRFGFDQPVADAVPVDPSTIDVALVPGLAFDRSGVRLGRGGGHYDRLLRHLRPGVPVVGVAPEAVVVDSLPAEAHDVPMTHLATETGVRPVDPHDELLAAARAWIAGDPDPDTRGELQALIDAGDLAGVAAHLGPPLRFGTAGIRGRVGAGPGRMNRAMVILATHGLAGSLRERGLGSVVLAYDARLTSRVFAGDAAGVLAAAGIEVRFFEGTAPTPLAAFAVLETGAGAGVVITASHNPAGDNGYKVYADNGAQIIGPMDGEIASAIDRAPAAVDIPRVDGVLDGGSPLGRPLLGMEDRYVDAVLGFRGGAPGRTRPRIVYTALHGVAGAVCTRLLETGGHEVTVVPEQFSPDGTFPTTPFPNPEEAGALDLAEALGSSMEADLVIANDPDGDRLAVSVPISGGWRRLSGNEIGVLLGDFVLERRRESDRDLVVNTVVSSPMLGAVAAARGVRFEQTLTGFKWICNAAIDQELQGLRFLFGYEEALGYTIGTVVRDKDGMSAALWFADLAAVEADRGRTVLDRLQDLWDRHGLWMSAQHSVTREGPQGTAEIAAAMGRLRTATPRSVGGRAVVGMSDFAVGAGNRPRWLPPTNLVVLHLEGGSRVLARPSGTEPKLKCYADIRGEGDEQAVRSEAERLARELAELIGL